MASFEPKAAAQTEESAILKFQTRVRRWKRRKGEDLEEIVANTLFEYAKFKSSECVVENPLHWLLRTAKYKRLEWHRSETSARRAIDAITPQVSQWHNKKPLTTPWHEMVTEESSHINWDSIPDWQGISKERKEMLHLVCVSDWRVTHAARALGVKRTTAKSWIARDLRRLKESRSLKAQADARYCI